MESMVNRRITFYEKDPNKSTGENPVYSGKIIGYYLHDGNSIFIVQSDKDQETQIHVPGVNIKIINKN